MTGKAEPTIRRINPTELGTPPGYSQIVDVSAGQTALDSGGHRSASPILPPRPNRCFAIWPSP
jgi:hypothetical protein